MPMQRKPTRNKLTDTQVLNLKEPWNATFNIAPDSRTDNKHSASKRKHRNEITTTLFVLVLLVIASFGLAFLISN